MVPQLGHGPGFMIPRKRVGAGFGGMWLVENSLASRGQWDDANMCKKKGGRNFEVSVGTYSESDEMCKNPLDFSSADSGLSVDGVSTACDGKETGVQCVEHMTDIVPNLPASLPYDLQDLLVSRYGEEIYKPVNGSRVDESNDETAGCGDDEPDMGFDELFDILEKEPRVHNHDAEQVSRKTDDAHQITGCSIPEEAVGFLAGGAENRHLLPESLHKGDANSYETQPLPLQVKDETEFGFSTPPDGKFSAAWTSRRSVDEHEFISFSSSAQESSQGASEGFFSQSENDSLLFLSSPEEDSWPPPASRLHSGIPTEGSQGRPPFEAVTMYSPPKSDGLSTFPRLDFQIDHERPTQNYGSELASSTALSGPVSAMDCTGTFRPTSLTTGMLSKAPSLRSSIVDLTEDSDEDDDVELLGVSVHAGVLGKRRMQEVCDLAIKKRMAISAFGGSSYPWKPRPKPAFSEDQCRQAVDFRTSNSNSLWVPEPRPLHWDLPGPFYSPESSSLSLCLNSNMAGGRIIQNSERKEPTHVNSSFGIEHNRSFLESHLAAYQSSNPAGLTNHISSGFREDKAGKSLKAVLQQTAMVENLKETFVDPGLLSVELLKHQRIALNWMEEREAKMGLPYGGILADDQGLGKTISTISLILKARAPVRKRAVETSEPSPLEAATVDLGDDDDSHPVGVNIFDTSAGEKTNTKGQATEGFKRGGNGTAEDVKMIGTKGRPAAGTLVVCPTSVLRQWGSELKEKVTEAADLSVLVYHGSNRTKDPEELAKYDVVLTTYSIVSMEVPKQPLPEEQDVDKKNPSEFDVPPPFRPSKPKKPRKTGDNAKKARGNGKGRFVEGENGSIDSGPLARVNWFRVVLDEAQSIKNSRTQVARAAWGLRAKRRWCLSGTPIQNAIDDLYSYFRFLRYAPYDGFRTFREKIKDRVNRTPEEGYKALQGLLSAVMLRRTKDTLIDGKPIVNLPQRIVTLKQTEFSDDERMFYTNLEIESRKQFQGYADAGTVQSNYVNILWMLLRLRQACNHPLLVKGHKAQSAQKIVMDSARALPSELRSQLLGVLETNRAICPICNDPPDDAVVCVCTHVFCRQCISEQLATGDDNCCPVPKCKKQLNLSLIFTLASLKSCDGDAGDSTLGTLLVDGTSDDGRSLEETEWRPSSKINAVIDTLNALPKVTVFVENGKVIAEISENSEDVNLVNIPDLRIGNRKPPSPEAVTATEVKISTPDVKAENPPWSSSQSIQTPTSVTQAPSSGGIEDVADPAKCKDTGSRVVQSTEKAIVFSQWTSMLDLLEISLKQAKFNYRRLDGTMSVLARDKAVAEFKTLPEVTVIIMSLKAASLGLNMVAACHVLLLDVWWNPTTEDQAIDRAHRIGQKKTVRVSRFTVRNTIEDRILALQERKRQIVASAFGDGEAGGQKTTRLSAADLEYLFRL